MIMSSSKQPKFETSFDHDANGAVFKDLIKKSNSNASNGNASNGNNNHTNGNGSSASNDNDQKQEQQLTKTNTNQQQLNNLKFPPLNALNEPNKNKLSSSNDININNQQDSAPPEDLNLFINDLLEQMQLKFENMGNSIIGRIDDMGSRIDTLEESIGDLMDQSGLSEPTYGSSGHSIKKKNTDQSKSDDASSKSIISNNF